MPRKVLADGARNQPLAHVKTHGGFLLINLNGVQVENPSICIEFLSTDSTPVYAKFSLASTDQMIVQVDVSPMSLELQSTRAMQGTIRYRWCSASEAAIRLFTSGIISALRHNDWGFFFRSGRAYIRAGILTGAKRWLTAIARKDFLLRITEYTAWVRLAEPSTDTHATTEQVSLHSNDSGPLISVVVPVYNTEERWLRSAIESVIRQTYSNWELCIADDASTKKHVSDVLESYANKDSRIKVVYRKENGHIARASNSALTLATGEYIALLDHDDELAPHALEEIAKELVRWPETDLLYTDEDKIDSAGHRSGPVFKPDWNPDLLYSLNMVTHLSVFSASVVAEVGGFQVGTEGSQDYDITLRVLEKTTPNRVRHLPQILYHWRMVPGSVAFLESEKDYAHVQARKVISEHLNRTGKCADVVKGFGNFHRISCSLPDPAPGVSVIIAVGASAQHQLSKCVETIARTGWPSLELLLVGPDDTAIKAFEQRELPPGTTTKLLRGAPRNRAACFNNAADAAAHPYIVFLSAETLCSDPKWLAELVRHASRPEIGAVGARIDYGNGRIHRWGAMLGLNGAASFPHIDTANPSGIVFHPAPVIQNFSGLSSDCMMLRKTVFLEAGGLDPNWMSSDLADIDLCLRVWSLGLRVVWTPHSHVKNLNTPEAVLRLTTEDKSRFKKEWEQLAERDPFLSPRLSRESAHFALAFPPLNQASRPWGLLDELAE